MDSLNLFIRDIALKENSNDPVAADFFKAFSKSFRRITSNSVLQIRLAEEAVTYAFGIAVECIDPNSRFRKSLDSGLNNYIEHEPLLGKLDKAKREMVRLAVVRVAYYIVFFKIAFDEELVPQGRTKHIAEYFESIFNKYIPKEKVEADTQLSTEDFLQKLKFVYKQVYRSLPDCYIPANLFLSLSLIDFTDFENREWRYFVNFATLDGCLTILSSQRFAIERRHLYDYINKNMPEMHDNFTLSQMDRFISLHQANKALNNQYVQLMAKVGANAINDSHEVLSAKLIKLQNRLSETTMNNVALESINHSLQKDIESMRLTINELSAANLSLKKANEELEKELDIMKSKNSADEEPEPLSFYIKDKQLLKRIIDYAESKQCAKKISFYNQIYRELYKAGILKETLRSSEFLRALIPHLKHLTGINSQDINPRDIQSLQQTIRINDAKQL